MAEGRQRVLQFFRWLALPGWTCDWKDCPSGPDRLGEATVPTTIRRSRRSFHYSWAIKNDCSPRSIQCNGVNQRARFPISARDGFNQSLSDFDPAPQSGWIRFDTGFIQKNQSLRIDHQLCGPPVGPFDRNISWVLFRREMTFFEAASDAM